MADGSELYAPLGGELTEAEIREHLAEARTTVSKLLAQADAGGGAHEVRYTQKRHSQLDRVLALIVAHFSIGMHLGGNRRRELETKMKDLETRLDTAEVKLLESETRGIAYRGIWQPGELYRRGDVTTADGSAFVCVQPNSGDRPGDSRSWQLAVKRGRDAKEART